MPLPDQTVLQHAFLVTHYALGAGQGFPRPGLAGRLPEPATAAAAASMFGWAGGIVGVVSGWPQAWTLWARRRWAGLSTVAAAFGVLNPVAWLLYGVASHSVVQIASNVVGLACGVVILLGLLRITRPPLRSYLPLLAGGLAAIAACALAGRAAVGVLATASTCVGIAPQLWVLWRDRRCGADVSGVSRVRWALGLSCNLCWLGYAIGAHDLVVGASSVVVGLMSVAVLALTVRRVAPPMAATAKLELAA